MQSSDEFKSLKASFGFLRRSFFLSFSRCEVGLSKSATCTHTAGVCVFSLVARPCQVSNLS